MDILQVDGVDGSSAPSTIKSLRQAVRSRERNHSDEAATKPGPAARGRKSALREEHRELNHRQGAAAQERGDIDRLQHTVTGIQTIQRGEGGDSAPERDVLAARAGIAQRRCGQLRIDLV